MAAFQVLSCKRLNAHTIKIGAVERSFLEVWQAYANGPFSDPSLQLAKYLPPLLDAHDQHPEMKLLDIQYQPSEIKMPNEVKFNLYWSNRIQLSDGLKVDAGSIGLEENPLKEPVYVSYGSYTTSKLWTQDTDGVPFATTAGEPIPHQEEVEYSCWEVAKKVAKYPKAFGSIVNGPRMFINDDKVTWLGEKFEKHTLLIRNIRAGELAVKNNYLYYPMMFSLMHNPDTWLVKKLNVGFLSLQPVAYRDAVGQTRYELKPMPIKVGKPEAFPSQPMPLQNKPNNTDMDGWPKVHGMCFPEYVSSDPVAAPSGYVDNAHIDPKRLKEIWEEATLTFKTKQAIKFKNNVPGF